MTKAYLIDAKAFTVEVVIIDRDNATLYRLLACETFQAVYLENRSGDMLFCDEEGKLNGATEKYGAFATSLFPGDVIAGRGLVVGIGGDGEMADPKTSLEEVSNSIAWMIGSPV